MKVSILGINGQSKSSIATYLGSSNHLVIRASRNEIEFDMFNTPKKLENYLDYKKSNIAFNAIETIDSCEDIHLKIFNAIFLPNYLMFRHYKEKLIEIYTYILSLCSDFADKPRKEFPIYSAFKRAQFALFQTPWEIFDKSKLEWFYSIFSRFSVGPGNVFYKNGSENDYQLIGVEIDKIFDKSRIL
jgi:hypothetical protein